MLLLLFSLVCLWASSESASLRFPQKGCTFEGRLFPKGSKFEPTPCMTCHCPHDGGIANCAVQDCMPDQNCITLDNSTTACCPTCLDFGCRHSDGRLFHQGEVIRNEPCVRCYCPFGGGTPVCDVTSCPLSQCVDPVTVPGVCCPICPNGPNCQIGLLTLPIGQSVLVEGARCVCESFLDAEGQERTMARCNKN
ncbi:hypothetical protein BsWGS_25263 [Bradybaena similaris]